MFRMCVGGMSHIRMPRKGPPALAVDGEAMGFGTCFSNTTHSRVSDDPFLCVSLRERLERERRERE